jgi:single-stranded-DNA-specific exonuclease
VERAKEYAEELCEINRQRQVEENSIATEAYEMIEKDASYDNDKVLILHNDNWHQGIIGIVASRITEKYGLPSILVSFRGAVTGEPHEMDDGKGSGRSIKGLNLVEGLNYCEDVLVKYGGHELAAGLTVKRGQLDEFRKRINEYADKYVTEDMLAIRLDADCELEAADVNMRFATEIGRLEPFGIGNASPRFIIRNATVRKIIPIGGGKHVKMLIEKDGICHTAMYFGVCEAELGCTEGDVTDVLFNIDVNEYRGAVSVQLIVQDIKICREFTNRLELEMARYEEIRKGAEFASSEQVIPTREDFAVVYTALRKEFRGGTSILDTKDILKTVSGAESSAINYIKLKFILRILNELKICEIEEIDRELYRFDIFFNANKTNIEKSSILKKLRGQCLNKA